MIESEYSLTKFEIGSTYIKVAFPCISEGCLRRDLVHIIRMFDLDFGPLGFCQSRKVCEHFPLKIPAWQATARRGTIPFPRRYLSEYIERSRLETL